MVKDWLIKVTDDYLILNKPAGLLTIPDRHDQELPSLQTQLKRAYGNIFTVHRLDRDTSGLILFARNEAAHRYYSQLFESREVRKFYQGLVTGELVPPVGSVDEPIMEHPVQRGKMVTNRRGKPP